jgi:hypothetical protein
LRSIARLWGDFSYNVFSKRLQLFSRAQGVLKIPPNLSGTMRPGQPRRGPRHNEFSMNPIQFLAAALAACSLAGCIVLPPPMPYRPPPPGFRGEAPPMPYGPAGGARRPPPPEWREGCDAQPGAPGLGNDCVRAAPGEPEAAPQGAR